MPESAVDRVTRSFRADSAYLPIHIASLRIDTVTDFDLYYQVRADEPVVLYAERNIPFTEDSRARLVENQVEYLYISSEQEGLYRGYLERNLSVLLSDDAIDIESKTEILYSSAHGLMQEIFEKPMLDGGLARSTELVDNTVKFMQAERSALRHLIETAATDYHTFTHSVNGCVLGIALAQRIGYEMQTQVRDFGRGALLRDIGITKIDPALRDNPGKLTVSQYEQIKDHPAESERMLRELGEKSAIVLDLARHHHERLDGSGYPDRLRGEEIAPIVRILTITDVFDSLTTRRPYQRRLGTFDALQLMSYDMQDELDSDFLRAFISMMGNPFPR